MLGHTTQVAGGTDYPARMRPPTDDELPLTCEGCGEETGLAFDESFASCDVPCRRCRAVLHWRHCPVCETGGQVESPESPCPSCGAPAGEREPPEPVPPIDRDCASRWERITTVACPACGRSFAWLPARAGTRGGFPCSRCGRLLEDASPAWSGVARAVLAVLLGLALLTGANDLGHAVLGPPAYAPLRTLWRFACGIVIALGGVLSVARPVRLRVYRAPRTGRV